MIHVNFRNVIAAVAVLFSVSVFAESPVDMTIDENIASPAVTGKAQAPVIRHMEKLGAVLSKHGFKVTPMRKGEVLRVAVPCSQLFAPNQGSLMQGAARYLSAFRDIVRLPKHYKVLVVVHTDDAGSADYLDSLSEERANAIDEYYVQSLDKDDLNIVPYGVGNDEPLLPNTSIGNRAANRRVDFYIIPGQSLIDQARSGRL